MNFISAKLVSEGGNVWVVKEDMKLLVPEDKVERLGHLVGKETTFGIRPEDIYDKMYAVAPKDEFTVKGNVDVVEPLGSETLIHATIHGDEIVAKVDPKSRASAGDKMDLVFDMSMMHLFDPETEENVLAGTHQDATPVNI
jgi:multiple sugar transport system ATP-binding protein